MSTLKISPGIDGIPTNTIPDDPQAFVSWFKNVGIKRWLANADTRNATAGTGISITGSISTPATISLSNEISEIFAQPFVLVGSPVGGATLTGYRSIAAQSGVVSLADGGAESSITVGIVANGIGNNQIRQASPTSVIGNSSATLGNVADIIATGNGQVLTVTGGTLGFGVLSATALAPIANSTVLANTSGSPAAPSATTLASLTANPSASIGLTAVNGTATTFMTSDSAPALSQAITPTWTGAHIFAATSGIPLTAQSGSSGIVQIGRFAGLNATGMYTTYYDNANSAARGYIGYGAQCVSGAAISDFAISAAGGNILFGCNNTTAIAGKIANAGNWTLNNPASGVTLTVNGTTGGNIAAVTDGTQTFSVQTAAGTVYAGAYSNSALALFTNNSTRMTISAAGAASFTGTLAINGGTPTAALSGFGSPSGTPTSGLTSAATLAQTAGTLAALLAYLKTIGFIAA